MGDGRRMFLSEVGDAPAAASVGRRGPGGRLMPDAIGGSPVGTLDGGDPDYIDELEGPPAFPGCRPGEDPEGDERRRLERLAAPPTPKPAATGEERDRLVAGCAAAVLGSAMIFGAGDALVRWLADHLGISVEEAERLLGEELARRAAAG